MALSKFSRFYYGIEIDETNNTLCIQDQLPLTDITYIRVRNGNYSFTEFILELKRALDEGANQIYSISLDRHTRKISISATNNFNLFFSSVADNESLMGDVSGFGSVDYENLNNYEAIGPMGKEYSPQFWLQDYVAFGESGGLVEASINKTASGKVEVIKFGNESFVELNIKWITNQEIGCGSFIRENPRGLEDAIDFMKYLITKGRLEFMEDEKSPGSFLTLFLEKSPESSTGIKYKLKEQVTKGIPGVYETGVLVFKVIGE